ncbi:phosphatidylserine/phosphatidylglycerophosphate/cardiolipin synthase family protein [uncultured Aquitalea sp.]|uniref:phospholipase D-like domain-containing protein n=1 Tax=uncultured Aquitalea sp. TaxID=540272 RepID=UPI0025FA5668|nr:phosphatidylserine/phosphatidylglycerophosphate/cardiolipin synthase family protein [uncultured Aquitalea sp.]
MQTDSKNHSGNSGNPMDFVRQLADQAFSRSAGAPLVAGNHMGLLFDSTENFPAWETALAGATDSIFIEMYILSNDAFGQRMLDILTQKAREGVKVCLLYDWLGSWQLALRRGFRALQAAGGEVRAYNPPTLTGGLTLLGRNHRKSIVVDRKTAFISGLCMSASWQGQPDKGIPPWRDTGLWVSGPLVADALAAFADSWSSCGGALDERWLRTALETANNGAVSARLIATTPSTAHMMRLDLLIASFARRTLWLTDAYFMGTSTYLTALKQAARDGVDVRLLVPRSSDIRWIATVSRTLFRPLLEAGVRVFEWNGPMIHAKTAVADGRWARIGSTNLNLSSWLANREIDVAIEDENLAGQLAEQFLKDLDNATEVVLAGARRRPELTQPRRWRMPSPAEAARSGASAAARQAARIGDALGAVVRGSRTIDASEASAFLTIGLALLLLATAIVFFPWLVAGPLVFLLALSGGAITLKALALYRDRKYKKQQLAEGKNTSPPDEGHTP